MKQPRVWISLNLKSRRYVVVKTVLNVQTRNEGRITYFTLNHSRVSTCWKSYDSVWFTSFFQENTQEVLSLEGHWCRSRTTKSLFDKLNHLVIH